MNKHALLAAARELEKMSFDEMNRKMEKEYATDAEELLAVKTNELATMIRKEAEENYEIVIDEKFAEQLANHSEDGTPISPR